MADALTELAERCEAATEVSKELDRAIFDAVTGGVFGPDNARFWHSTSMTSRAANSFTASIDAAMTLVPSDFHLQLSGLNDAWHAEINSTADGPNIVVSRNALTAPLAICAAALRARAAKAA